ncbi:unnamed protein product [Didymodactylos carnosus]|uniref:Splicing factor 3A subunit 1 n=1 Tax=Didymodactylos carnosus TaxID=1234261 RepID=A0A813PCD5_9BILA|nr:unnamed protein product [Didymodactylos carnosus]CAF1122607.1 unnamed protein product [Didymodactylos carnosus]CAF3530247.1 unnamed protein product [Didymodactylos carnosus]CAF3897818.1 unnamed protein product [Didymodactylos carnosus]
MPPVELSQTNTGDSSGSAANITVPTITPAFIPPSVKSKIGIIYPPPEVRNIVDKTASFVARNGPGFEKKVKDAEQQNSKFNFLNSNDPYHAYYLHKVKEFQEGKTQLPPDNQIQTTPTAATTKLQSKVPSEISKIIETTFVRDPPPDYEFLADPPSISGLNLDIVKLTAQFVARNGRQFLTSLMSKEVRNNQFDFLKPQHGLFNYFTKLVEQYTKVLIPPKDLMNKLKAEVDHPQKVMDDVNYRVEWVRHQVREKAREEEAFEKERAAYSQIDWHDFVVVETVDYQPQEQGNFPPPTTPEHVGARMLIQERLDRTSFPHSAAMMDLADLAAEMDMASPPGSPQHTNDRNMQHIDMDQDEDEGTTIIAAVPSVPILLTTPRLTPAPLVTIPNIAEIRRAQPPLPSSLPPPPPSTMNMGIPPTLPAAHLPSVLKPDQVIVKQYNPKDKVITLPENEQYLISPFTKEKIPASRISDHTKYALLDPTWIQRREKEVYEQQEKEAVYEPGSNVDIQLKKFAERRTDIFGKGTLETTIGRKIGEEDRRVEEKPTWDGHTATVEKTSKKAMAGITLEEQITAIHRSQGLIDDDMANRIGPIIPKSSPVTYNITPSQASKTIQKPPQPATKTVTISAPAQPSTMRPGQGGMLVTPITLQRSQPTGLILNTTPALQQMVGVRPMISLGQSELHPHPTDEPSSKRMKTEEQLMPEEEFYQKFGKVQRIGAVTFTVQLPVVTEKSEWNLNGQAIPMTLPVTDTISLIKAKLSDLLGGMPAGKQKLQYEGMFLKDSNTLGFYNMLKGSLMYLQLKERGGRKK